MGGWRKARTGIGNQASARVTTGVPIRVSTVDPEIDPDSGEAFFRSSEETTANLSRGGAFVRSWEPLAAGRRVIVEIELPDGAPLQLVARVAWTRRRLRANAPRGEDEPGYGLEFVGGSRAEHAVLDRFLTRLETSTEPAPGPPGPMAFSRP